MRSGFQVVDTTGDTVETAIFMPGEQLDVWLLAGAELPDEFRVNNYAFPGDTREGKPVSGPGWRDYVQEASAGFVYGESCRMHYSRPIRDETVGVVRFKMDRSLENEAHARTLFDHFLSVGALCGRCCLPGEYAARHQWRFRPSGVGLSSSAYVGRSVEHRVPGLYWLNLFSDAYASRFGIDPVAIARALDGSLTPCVGGVVLQLYDGSIHWELKCEQVEAYLRDDPAFFSLQELPVPGRKLTVVELTEFMGKLQDDWP